MKFSQLIEYNRNIFLRKIMHKMWCNSFRPFFKNKNWAYLSINSLKFNPFFFFFFFLYVQVEDYQNTLNYGPNNLLLTSYKVFL